MKHQYSSFRRMVSLLTAYSFIFSNMLTVNLAYAGQIVPDGKTRTAVTVRKNVTDITTSTIRGKNAYNSFSQFDIDAGNIANLHVPGSAGNLMNLVHDKRSNIDGVLNAYKNGQISGNVFFANPHGFVVGASGVINVGSLTVSTPTKRFMEGFFDASGNPTDAATQQLLNSTAPINESALISIEGQINATDSVKLQAGDITNRGVVTAGATASKAVGFTDLVNTDNLESGAGIVEKNGEIFILAANDFVNAGQIRGDGASNIDAGNITVIAGNNITLSDDSSISARGRGENSNGGTVVVLADNRATIKDHAALNASGGDISGNGGFVEFSAKDTVELGGGSLQAAAVDGEQGTVLIDPPNLDVTTDILRGVTASSEGLTWDAGSLTLEADEKITIRFNKVVSTRQVGENTVTAHRSGVSTGSSGDLTLKARQIELEKGAMLLAHVEGNNDYTAGDIKLEASATDHPGLTIADANSSILIDGADIWAKNITLDSKADAAYDWGGDADDIVLGLVPTLARGVSTQLTGINVGLAIARGTSSVKITNGASLRAADTVKLNSETNAKASTYTFAKPGANKGALALGVIYGETTSHATVDVQSRARIQAETLDIDARNTADLNLNVYAISTADAANAAVAYGKGDVKSEAKIADGAFINVSKEVSIAAVNNDRFVVSSAAIALEAGKAGVSVAILDTDNSATAFSNADMNLTGLETLNIQALDNNVTNKVTSSATAGSGFLAKYVTGPVLTQMNNSANKLMSKVMEIKPPAPGATSKPKLAGALSYADSKQTATASIGDKVIVKASKDVTITAKVEDERLQNQAQSLVASETDNPTPENPAATTAVSVAVAYGDYIHTADAHIGEGADVSAQHVGVRSDVLVPWEETWTKWEGLNSIVTRLNGNLGVVNGFLTGYANAQSAADNFSLAGAVTWLDFNNTSTAYLGKNASITILPDTILPDGETSWASSRIDGTTEYELDLDCILTIGCNKLSWEENDLVNWEGSVSVTANTEVEGVFSSGNIGITLNGIGGEAGGKAVGASFNQIDYANTTRAFIAEGAEVQQMAASEAVDIAVVAASRENMIVVSPTAGRGASFGLNGQVSIATIDNATEASIDDEAKITARNLSIDATDEVVAWALSGAFNMSDTAAVGIAVAHNDIETSTNAFIGDNDGNLIAGSTLDLTDGEVKADDIAVAGRTDGRVESYAIAATLANSSDGEPGIFDKINDKIKPIKNKVETKLTSVTKWLTDNLEKLPSGSGTPSKSANKPTFGLGISGASAVTVSDMDTNAYIKHPNVTGTGALSSLDISAVNDTDITAASGSAALTRAKSPDSKRSAAIAGAVTYNILKNDTHAFVEDSTVTHVKDVDIKALEGGEQLSIAIGAALNISADKSKAASVAGSVSISQAENTVKAYIKDSTVLGNNDGADRGDMNLIAYDRTRLGTGAGSLFAGGKSGFGAAITYSDIENTAAASIENSNILDPVAGHGGYDTIQVQGLTAAKIAAGGGMIGVTDTSGGNSLAGAVVVNDINNRVSAEIRANSTVIATEEVNLLARDINAVASLDAIIDKEDQGNANAESLDYDGTSMGFAVPAGSSVLAVAGVVQAGLEGGNNVGASITRNTISNKFSARITDSEVKTQTRLLPGMADPTGISQDPAVISATPVTTGNINVIARSNATITGIALGVGYATDQFAGAGSAVSNEIENETRAQISSTSGQKISTQNLALSAEDKSKIESLAGQVTRSIGAKAKAIGLALAHNEINNKTFASVTGMDINALASTDVKAENSSTLRTLSATAGGSKDFAFNGAVSIGLIGNETEAKIVDAKADEKKNKTLVWAKDRSTIETLSGGAAVATEGDGVGIAVAVNRIAGSTRAHVSGSAANSEYNLEHLHILSDSQATINTIAIGIGGGKDVGLGGSFTTNFVDNDVLAYIDDGANVVAQNYVGVITESDDRLTVAAGSAGVGKKSKGVGVSFAYNTIEGSAKAYIDGTDTGTQVSAYGKDPGDATYGYLGVNSGLLDTRVDLAKAIDLANYNKLDLRSLKQTEFVRGIAVNASSSQHVESIGANIGAGYNGGYGLVTTINSIAGMTDAYIQNSTINGDNTDGTQQQDLSVIASNHAYGNGFVGNLSLSVKGAAAGAAVDTHGISRHTRAAVNGGLLNTKGDLKLKAFSTQGVSSIAVGGSGGVDAIAGTLVYVKFFNTTEAFINHADVTADTVTVDADNENNLHLAAGAVSVGGNAAGGAFTVGLNESRTNAYILGDNDSLFRTKIKATGTVDVQANSKTRLGQTAIAGAGAGGKSVAGSAAVNILNNTTQAYIRQADIGTDAARVAKLTVSASDSVDVDTDSGAAAVGGTAGVGASVAYNALKSRVTSSIDDSTVYSDDAVDVTADSRNNIKALTFTGSAGGTAGISGAVVVNMVGSDVAGEADDEAGGTIHSVDDALNAVADTVIQLILPDSEAILSEDERIGMKASTRADVADISYGNDASAARYKTSATVLGANSIIDAASLKVAATDSTSTTSTAGGVAVGALGVGAGVAVTDVQANVIASIGAGVDVSTTGNIDVTAIAKKDVGEVINILAFAGAAGLVGVGAAVGIADIDNTVIARNDGDTDASSGIVSVEAKDSSGMVIEGVGAVVGAAAAGAVIARADKTSSVTAVSGASTVTAAGASIKATSEGVIIARTQSAAGGLTGAGNGADARATDNSSVKASTADASTFNLGSGTMTVEAEASPQTDALAQGVTVSGGLSIGVSIARATANPNVSASLGEYNEINAKNLTVTAKQTLGSTQSGDSRIVNVDVNPCVNGDCDSARARSFAASGGFSAAVGATEGEAQTLSIVNSGVGDNSILNITDTTTIGAETISKNRSVVTGITVGGFAAAGSNDSDANSNTQTTAVLGSDVKVTGNTLKVTAIGSDNNYSQATAGSGGLVAGVATKADTFSKSVTKAGAGSGSLGQGITVSELTIEANHTTEFNGKLNNLSASAIGASGANSDHLVDATVESRIGDDAWIEAGKITMNAVNTTQKPYLDGGDWNVTSASGGLLLDVPGATSESVIKQVTDANIGSNAQVKILAQPDMVTPAQPEDIVTEVREDLIVNAFNDIQAFDKVKINSAGGVAAPYGGSTIDIQQADAEVAVGANAQVISEKGDIKAGARSNVVLKTETVVDAYGLAGAPIGKAYSKYNGHNRITVEAGTTGTTTLRTENGSVVLAAGENTSGRSNNLDLEAKVNLWNKTAIPIPTPPDALVTVSNYNTVAVNDKSLVESEKDIGLFAMGGRVLASAKGIGKDIYRETLAAAASAVSNLFGGDDVSFDIKGGKETVTGLGTVNVSGSGKVRTGIRRNKSLTLETEPGSVTDQEPGGVLNVTANDVTYTQEFAIEIAQNLKDRMARLRKLQTDYAGTSVQYQAYAAEIKFLEKKLKDLGLATDDNPGTLAGSGISPFDSGSSLLALLEQNDVSLTREYDATVAAQEGKTTDLQLFIDRDTKTGQRTTARAQLTAENNKAADDRDTALITRLNQQISALTGEITALSLNISDQGLVRPVVEADIATLNARIEDQEAQLITLNGRISDLVAELPTLSKTPAKGPSADFVLVDDVSVRLGNLNIRADVLSGDGHLESPGDARIDITNNTTAFLKVNKLTIDSNLGGRISLNGIGVSSVDSINQINGAGSTYAAFQTVLSKDSVGAAVPSIVINSFYNPDDSKFVARGPSPDIELNDDIYNPRGLVRAFNQSGSILVGPGADIFAGTVEIEAQNGDFVQSYTDNFFESGGDPAAIFKGIVQPGGIVANGSVFIASRFLNINGLIQSGIERWAVDLPGTPTLTGSAAELGVAQSVINDLRTAYSNDKTLTTIEIPNDNGELLTYNYVEDRLEADLAFVTDDAASDNGKKRNETGLYSILLPQDNKDENYVATIGANYDALNDRYELNGIEVYGGYIQLYGQILNTSNTGTGILKVLDGYGTINVTNPTSRDVVINKLNTGSGVAGVIDITDIQFLDLASTPFSINTVITRENGNIKTEKKWVYGDFEGQTNTTAVSGAETVYNPQAGLRYQWDTGTDQSTTNHYRYEGTTLFGSSALTVQSNISNRIAGPIDSDPTDLAEGRLLLRNQDLGLGYHEDNADDPLIITNGPSEFSPVTTVSDCNWWTLCAAQDVVSTWSTIVPTKEIVTNSLKADYPITILFSGEDEGSINVVSSGGGDILLKGGITNTNGTTTIVSANASIRQHDENALITTKELNLIATNNIGDENPVQYIQSGSDAVLNAWSGSGDINVRHAVGDLSLGSVLANAGRVRISSDGNIVQAGPNARLSARRVELISENGGIGTAAAAVVLETGYTDDIGLRGSYGLNAGARDDIHIQSVADTGSTDNAAGDLLVDRVVSVTGDVTLAADGQIIDNNLVEEIDTRTWETLLTYWKDVQLLKGSGDNEAKQAREIETFEDAKTEEYGRYWQARKQQANPGRYDANFKYAASENERYALTRRFTGTGVTPADIPAKISEFENQRTLEYHSLHAQVGTLNGGKYSSDYRYVSTAVEQAGFLKGSSWTERELGISVSSGLKEITDTNPVVKEANIAGQNVTLISGRDIGHTAGAIDIHTAISPEDLTPGQKVALAAAERSDLVSPDSSTIRILLRKSVNVDVGDAGVLTAVSSGNAYIGSEQTLRLNTVDALDDIRIKVGKSLVNANSDAASDHYNIRGGNTILEAAKGHIGEPGNPIILALNNGATLTARGLENIFLEERGGDINVDTVYTPGELTLKTPGSILDAFSMSPEKDELNIRSASFFPIVGNSIGESGNPLEIGVDSTGKVDADVPGDVYLASPFSALNIGDLIVGGNVGMAAGLKGIDIQNLLSTTGDIDLRSDGRIAVSRLESTAGLLNMASRFGSLNLGDFTTGGDVLMTAGNDITIQNWLTTTGGIDLRSGGSIAVSRLESTTGTLNLKDVVAGRGFVDIQVSGNAQIDNLLAAEDANLVVSGDNLTINTSVSDSLTLTVLTEGGKLNVVDATLSRQLTAMADTIVMPSVLHSPALDLLHVSAAGNDGGMADAILLNIESAIGSVFDTFKARQFDMNFNNDNLVLSGLVVGDKGRIITPIHKIYIDNVNRYLETDATAQLYAPGVPFDLTLTKQNLLFTDALAINYDPDFIINRFSTENSLVRLGNKRLAQQQKRWQEQGKDVTPLPLLLPGSNEVLFDGALILDDEDSISDETFLEISNVEPEYNE